MSGNLRTARVYDARSGELEENGSSPAALILVDRLWPRGFKKTDLSLAGWPKELTPSSQLRRDFHSSDLGWEAFTAAYQEELDDRLGNGELDSALRLIRDLLENGDVVLLYAGKDSEHSHAVVLRDWLFGVLSTQ